MKRKLFRVGLWVLGAVTLLVFGGFAYFSIVFPKAEPTPELTIERTPERVKRGEYLANHVAVCLDCHSQRDWSRYSGPPKPGTRGVGGDHFGKELGLPGDLYTKNLTPYALGSWTDGEIYRAITTGVNREGKALFPLMPYNHYGMADPEDVKDIIAYLRTLPTVKNDVPERKLDFPLNFIVETLPHPANPQKKPDTLDRVAYGKYLITMASCDDCHTPVGDDHNPIPGREFSGGSEIKLPWGTIRPANLTPDPETGLGRWTEEQFVARFKAHASKEFTSPNVDPKGFNTIMPWVMYGGMKEGDLKAIFAYLRTVKPVKNLVVKYTPSTSAQPVAKN
jgi:mono/diheme cytochrome c family protein